MKKTLILLLVILVAALQIYSAYAAGFDMPTVLIDSPYDFGLQDYYPAIRGTDMKSVFEQAKAELPDEIPVVVPREVKGQTEFFVSPDAKGSSVGTIDNPFSTVQQALDKVAAMGYEQRRNGVVIYLRGGNYKFSETLNITRSASGTKEAPLFISAYNGEEVNITPSDVLTAEDFSKVTDAKKLALLPEEARDKVLVADLRSKGINDYNPISHGDEGMTNAVQAMETKLYWNNMNMTLARWPNYSYVQVGPVTDPGPITQIESGGASGIPDDGRGVEFELTNEHPLSWTDTDDIYIYGFLCFEWVPANYKIRYINKETKSLRTYTTAQWGARERPGNQYFFFNVFEELDAPGEWYLDRKEGKLYIFPYEGIETATISLSINGMDLITVNGGKHIYFNGLNLKCNSESAFILSRCEDVVVQNCDISLMGKFGVDIRESTYCGVTTTVVFNTDQHCVQIGHNHYLNNSLIPSRNFVQNNFFSRQGNDSHSAAFVGGNVGDIVSHNLFQKFAAQAATPLGSESVFEYNEIVSTPYEVHDMGAIYTGGVENPYHHDRYNYIHDMSATAKLGNAMYYDTFGSTFFVYGNVLKNVPTGIYSHGGRNNVWVGNVIADRSNHQEVATRNGTNYYNPNNPSWRNEMLGEWSLMAKHWNGDVDLLKAERAARYPMWYDYILKFYEFRNQFQEEGYVRGAIEEELRLPSGSYISNNISYKHGDFSVNDIDKPIIDFENNLKTDTDPGFVDYDGNNLNFKEDAAVFKLLDGFTPPPFDKMGLLKGFRWDNLGITEAPSVVSPVDGSVGKYTFDNVVFKWTDVLCAGRYRLIVAEDANFENIVVDKEVDSSSSTERLSEPAKTYYWKVVALPLAKSLLPDTTETKVSSFTTMSFEEMNIYAKADKQYLVKEIDYSRVFMESLVEGDAIGQYPTGSKMEIQKALNEANTVNKNVNVQYFVDEAINDLRNAVNDVRATVKFGFVKLTKFDAASWREIHRLSGPTGAGENPAELIVADGIAELKSRPDGTSRIGATERLEMGVMHTFRANIADTVGWMALGKQEDIEAQFTATSNYCIVIKQDLIELQKYSEYKTWWVIDAAVNENKVIKANTWHEYAYGTFAVEGGVRVVLMVDGKTVIDFIDTDEPLYFEGHIAAHLQPENKSIKFAQSQMDYSDIILEEK